MDANTKDVLMALIALISAVVTPLVVVYVGRMNATKISIVKDKVEENHRLINGHLATLLQTTKDLATAQEKARAAAEIKHKKH